MNSTKLAIIINDTFDAVERSKVGNIYLRKEDGSLLTTTEGCPWCNQAAMGVFQSILHSVIIKEALNEN